RVTVSLPESRRARRTGAGTSRQWSGHRLRGAWLSAAGGLHLRDARGAGRGVQLPRRSVAPGTEDLAGLRPGVVVPADQGAAQAVAGVFVVEPAVSDD